MKCLFIYNPNSGRNVSVHKIRKITNKLSKVFNLVTHESLSVSDFNRTLANSLTDFDVIIVGGGDGTVNMAVNQIVVSNSNVKLGIIPLGTLNDSVKNIGCSSSINKSIKNIIKNKHKFVDIIQVNNSYALYTVAAGLFSNLSYITSPVLKRIFGRFAYYFTAIPQFFKKTTVSGLLEFDSGEQVNFNAPFFAILNGKRMGGFLINKSSSFDDGLAEIILPRRGAFRSIFNCIFHTKSISKYSSKSFVIHLNRTMPVIIDGEMIEESVLKIKILSRKIEIIG